MQIINNTLELLKRCDLKGSEVPAFIECVEYLKSLAQKEQQEIEVIQGE